MSALIDAQSLYARREDATLRMIDATYPANPGAYAQARIGNAVLFDIDAVCDHGTALPHMLPGAEDFAAAAGAMGIGNEDTVVVYDQTGMVFAAARVWWMFRVFGHKRVYVLDGGLPAWQKAGMPLERGPVSAPATKAYTAHFNPGLVRSVQEVQNAQGDPSTLLLDARPADR
ncbi:MAG: sulfurtransferase, partial [Micavibrio aeruginosavorus]|nr:sulfurtransferase [Micavibrio aeruginosavorus]